MATVRLLIKADQIQQAIEEKIRTGEYACGQRLPTEKELAVQFGCSLPTLNKAMAQLESRHLVERRSGKGTFIRKDPDLGLVPVVFDYAHLQNPEESVFYNALMKTLMDEVRQHHYKAHFVLGRGKRGEEFTASLEPESSLWKNAVGVIAMAGVDIFEDRMAAMGIPVLSIGTSGKGLHALQLDYETLGAMAAARLAGLGCRRLAVVGHIDEPNWAGYAGVRGELARRGIAAERAQWHIGIRGHSGARQLARTLCEAPAFPDGIIILDDTVAVPLLEALAEAGRIPGRDFHAAAHATAGVTPDYPAGVQPCGFSLDDMCQSAVRILGKLAGNADAVRRRSLHTVFPEL